MSVKRKLPEGWAWKKLGSKEGIAEIINGSTPSTANPEYWNGNILWATPSDLGTLDSIYIGDTERKITKAGLDSCSTTLLPVGSVLLTSRAPVGNLAIAKRPICTNQGFKSFIPKEGVSSLYLYFAITKIVPEIQKLSHGNTFTEITKELIQNFVVPLPPTINDQIAIATELERKMNEVEKMRHAALRQKAAINAMQGAVLREVFISKKDANWKFTKISEIADISMGQSPHGSTYNKKHIGVPLLNGPTEFGDKHPTPVQWTSSPKKLCQRGDLLICVRGNTTGKMNSADQEYCLGRGVAGIRGKVGKGDISFLKHALEFKINELLLGSERSTFPNLGKNDLNSFEILAPTDCSVQNEVAKYIEKKLITVDHLKTSVESQIRALEALPGAYLREVFEFGEA